MIPAYGGGEGYTSSHVDEFWTIHLPGLSDDEDRLLNHLLGQLRDRTPRNLLRASYYDGRRAVRQVGSIIPPQYYTLGLTLGWSAKAVDALAQRNADVDEGLHIVWQHIRLFEQQLDKHGTNPVINFPIRPRC